MTSERKEKQAEDEATDKDLPQKPKKICKSRSSECEGVRRRGCRKPKKAEDAEAQTRKGIPREKRL